MLSPQRKPSAPEPTARKKTGKKKVAAKATEPAATARTGAESDSGSKRSRFSAKGLKTHREQLGLSADSYGKLVGVSGLSIYNWEQEKARPRESSIAALASIRGLGKREAASRLGEPATPKAKAKTTAKTKATPTAKKKVKAKAKVQANRPTKKAKAQSEKKDG